LPTTIIVAWQDFIGLITNRYRVLLDVYTRAIPANKREINNKVMEMVIEAEKGRISAPSQREPLRLEGQQKRRRKLSAPSRVTTDLSLCHKLVFSLVYGGDDGARTRDLCRDS
jgi:hypothetical protein